MATTITTLVDKDGNQLLPRTRTEAIVMSDGTTTLESRLGLVVTAVDEVLTGALPRDADTLGGIPAVNYLKNTVLTAAGDLIYATASNTPTRLPKGAAGQYLKMNAEATAPEWGSLVIPSGLTAGSASVGFINYNGITQADGQWDGGTSTPNASTRLNYDGDLYATSLSVSTGYNLGSGAASIVYNSVTKSIDFIINE